MLDPDLLDTYPDDMLLDGEDDMLDDILNTLLDDSAQLEVKTEPSAKGNPSNLARRSLPQSSNKKRKYNPDAEKIAEVTEAALLSLDIDPNSQDAKKKRRQIRNRLSAQFHRDRKNAYIKELEDKNAVNQSLINNLQKRIQELERENTTLKEQMSYYHSTLRSGSTLSASDSESSSSGSSPVHQPNYYNPPTAASNSAVGVSGGLNSIREIVPSRSSSTIPLPVAKTLSLLSVLCILCMTYLDHPIKLNPPLESSSSVVDMSPRRRLEAPPSQRQMEQAFTYPMINESSSSSASTAQYLRGTATQPMEVNASHPTVIYTSKDLIPFDLPYPYQRDWYSRQNPFDDASLSYSRVVMKTGVALFDPAMKLHRPSQSLEESPSAENTRMVVVPTVKTLYHNDHPCPRLEYDQSVSNQIHGSHPRAVVMDVNESKESEDEEGLEEKHWPALTAPPATAAAYHLLPTRSLEAPPMMGMDCSHCGHDDTGLLAKLLEQSNLVTVTVPATSVRMGKTMQDSEDGTVEGIMEMFNLTNEYGEKSNSTVLPQNSLADASVEINCIILSAKLIMNAPKH